MGLFDEFKEILKTGDTKQRIIKMAENIQAFAETLDLEEGDETMEMIFLFIEQIKNAPDLKSAKSIKKELLIELLKRGLKMSPEDEDEEEDNDNSTDNGNDD